MDDEESFEEDSSEEETLSKEAAGKDFITKTMVSRCLDEETHIVSVLESNSNFVTPFGELDHAANGIPNVGVSDTLDDLKTNAKKDSTMLQMHSFAFSGGACHILLTKGSGKDAERWFGYVYDSGFGTGSAHSDQPLYEQYLERLYSKGYPRKHNVICKAIILSHAHRDHINSVRALVNACRFSRIESVILGGKMMYHTRDNVDYYFAKFLGSVAVDHPNCQFYLTLYKRSLNIMMDGFRNEIDSLYEQVRSFPSKEVRLKNVGCHILNEYAKLRVEKNMVAVPKKFYKDFVQEHIYKEDIHAYVNPQDRILTEDIHYLRHLKVGNIAIVFPVLNHTFRKTSDADCPTVALDDENALALMVAVYIIDTPETILRYGTSDEDPKIVNLLKINQVPPEALDEAAETPSYITAAMRVAAAAVSNPPNVAQQETIVNAAVEAALVGVGPLTPTDRSFATEGSASTGNTDSVEQTVEEIASRAARVVAIASVGTNKDTIKAVRQMVKNVLPHFSNAQVQQDRAAEARIADDMEPSRGQAAPVLVPDNDYVSESIPFEGNETEKERRLGYFIHPTRGTCVRYCILIPSDCPKKTMEQLCLTSVKAVFAPHHSDINSTYILSFAQLKAWSIQMIIFPMAERFLTPRRGYLAAALSQCKDSLSDTPAHNLHYHIFNHTHGNYTEENATLETLTPIANIPPAYGTYLNMPGVKAGQNRTAYDPVVYRRAEGCTKAVFTIPDVLIMRFVCNYKSREMHIWQPKWSHPVNEDTIQRANLSQRLINDPIPP